MTTNISSKFQNVHEVEEILEEHLDTGCVSRVLDKVNRLHWPEHVHRDEQAFMTVPEQWTRIEFPHPEPDRLIDVNMMPFDLFDVEKTIPAELRNYIPLIQKLRIPRILKLRIQMEFGMTTYASSKVVLPRKIAYLTVHESWMQPGADAASQRRSGLHVERPGSIAPEERGRMVGAKSSYDGYLQRTTMTDREADHDHLRQICWGGGYWDLDGGRGAPIDGIWMCSNIEGTTAIYDAIIEDPHVVSDRHGGIEHLRDVLDHQKNCTKTLLRANELCWFTDRTPHESLPLPEEWEGGPVIRQFFRVVVGRISVWYSKHNTPNPLGIEPEAIVSDAYKF